MTQDLEAWLKQMPPESAIEARIERVESELELLTALRQVRQFARTGGQTEAADAGDEPSLDELRKRMSPERLRILRAVTRLGKQAGIPAVAKAVNADRDNIASNMQRMIGAGLLERVGYGLYAATPGAMKLVEEAAGDDGRLAI
jgi:predicted transcriptional regulator